MITNIHQVIFAFFAFYSLLLQSELDIPRSTIDIYY